MRDACATQRDVDRADALCVRGEQFIDANHYAVDCIRPKCAELRRISAQYRGALSARYALLRTTRELLDKMDRVWISICMDYCFCLSICMTIYLHLHLYGSEYLYDLHVSVQLFLSLQFCFVICHFV